jgi:hypothetical protein
VEHELRPAGGGLPVRATSTWRGRRIPRCSRRPTRSHPRWRSLWFWDASLYGDHYYLYWGPLPAVAIAIVKTMFRIRGTVGDQFPLFARYTIYLVAGALLIARLSRRLFDGVPPG